MTTFWITALSGALLCALSAQAFGPDKKGRKKSQARTSTTRPDDPQSTKPTHVEPHGGIRTPLMFGGSLLTQERAEQIATSAGFTLIDFHACSGGTECAIFEVVTPAVEVYQYQVSSDRCTRPMVAGTVADGTLTPNRSLGSRSARKNTASSRTAQSVDPRSSGVDSASLTPGDVTNCFGAYTLVFRARQENALYADKLGYSTTIGQYYQTVKNGRWSDLYSVSANTWKFGREASSTVDIGWSHETRYANGVLRSGESQQVEGSPVSGSGQQSAAEVCEDSKAVMQANANVQVQAAHAACKAFPLPGSTTVNLEVDLKPWGVGASAGISATKTSDTCANFRDIGLAKNEAAASAYAQDCKSHPGRYFPYLFPPESGALTPDVLETAIKAKWQENGSVSAGYCPSSIVNYDVAVDMGNGSVCSADAVRYTCNTTTQGTCECSNPTIEGAITCTDNSVAPARVSGRRRVSKSTRNDKR